MKKKFVSSISVFLCTAILFLGTTVSYGEYKDTGSLENKTSAVRTSVVKARADSGIVNLGALFTTYEDNAGITNPDVKMGEVYLKWSEIEKEEGKYDWTVLDRDIGEWGRQNKRTIIRIVTAGHTPYDSPEWLFNNYNVKRIISKTGNQVGFPNYFDPLFKSKWQSFVEELAIRYNNNSSVYSVVVGGWGRWEEIMLDDDVYGNLDSQWISAGYSDKAYLEHIKWCMDLFKKNFTKKRLIAQLAYGLHEKTDRDIIYRRAAQFAVERDIFIKQNGMSHKYDTWDQYTNASYIYNRYRNDPSMAMIYEPGGSVAGSATNLYGHPISYLNRGMIDGTDYFYMYPFDLIHDNFTRYYHYASEQAGSALFTKIFNYLGDYPVENNRQIGQQKYQNIWQGIRQVDGKGYDPVFSVINGEKCATTDSDSGRIIFDIDDRQQYNGMYGTTFSVDYLDKGKDKFSILVYDNSIGKSRNAGTITKKNTGKWTTATFYLKDWCDSSRNRGADIQNDVIIDDLGDGTETIRYVELDYVPAAEWLRTMVSGKEPSGNKNFDVLKKSLETTIKLNAPEALRYISIPVKTMDDLKNGLSAKVFKKVGSKFVQCGSKNYYLPYDRDWFEIPIKDGVTSSEYKVVLEKPIGNVGWYKSQSGSFAYRAYAYKNNGSELSKGDFVKVQKGKFTSDYPFEGVRIKDGMVGNFGYKLYKQTEGSGSLALVSVGSFNNNKNSSFNIKFEPQTPGSYKLELYSANKLITKDVYLSPLKLKRLNEAKKPVDTIYGEIIRNWKPEKSKIEIAGLKPVTKSPSGLKIEAGNNQYINFSIKNRTSSAMARLYWAAPGEDFTPAKSTWVPVVANDTEFRTYSFAMGVESEWKGIIDRIALEPVTGKASFGWIELKDFSVSERRVAAELQFNERYDGLFDLIRNQVCSVNRELGTMKADYDGNAFRIMTSPWKFAFAPDSSQKLELKVMNNTDIANWIVKLRYRSKAKFTNIPKYDEEHNLLYQLTMNVNDGKFTTYEFSLDENKEFLNKDMILSVVIEPVDKSARSGYLEIDSMKVYK